MGEIKKLKIKYIFLSLFSLFLLLTFIIIGLNMINYNEVTDEADNTLSILSNNNGRFPSSESNENNELLPSWMSPEVPYESRFFSVYISKYNIISVETRQIYSVGAKEAVKYANTAIQSNNQTGFIDKYRYMITYEENGTRVVFLDCGRKLALYYEFSNSSIQMAIIGYVAIAIFVCFFVNRFIRPVAESYKKQKRFITDAGHEIKTPLAIIKANVDVLEMDIGENEYLADITTQISRLTDLTNNLVSLSKMEEAKNFMIMIDFPVSETISDVVSSFQTLAKSQNKSIVSEIQPLLTIKGNDMAISQLVSILLENAIKYSPPNGTIFVSLSKHGRKVILKTENNSLNKISEKDIKHIFDRFYRADESRNSETGGYGIGLSMAKAIVTAHGGKINATCKDGLFSIKATFPS